MTLSQDDNNNGCSANKTTPYLLNMSDDPTLAGCLLYYIVPGRMTTIGSAEGNIIRLRGIGISAHLCVIENADNSSLVVWKCSAEGRVVVGGKKLDAGKSLNLNHGQRLYLGRAFAMKATVPS